MKRLNHVGRDSSEAIVVGLVFILSDRQNATPLVPKASEVVGLRRYAGKHSDARRIMIAEELGRKDIAVRETEYGRGLFATVNLPIGVVVMVFSGPIVATYDQVPEEMRCHSAALSNGTWLVPNGDAQYLNGSAFVMVSVEPKSST